jgi:hypothetical protein
LDKRKAYSILVGEPEGKDHQEDLNIGERIISKLILEKQNGVIWAGFIWLTIEIVLWTK